MKSLLYLFRRYTFASLLNLFGIILAFTGCYILFTQISFVSSFNHGIKDYERIYRIYERGIMEEGVWDSNVTRPFIEKLKDLPQVESIGFFRSNINMEFDKEGSVFTYALNFCNADMLTTVNAELVDGSLTVSQENGKYIVIPASLAEKYFGEVMVAGREMKTQNGRIFIVGGVYKDFSDNCNFANTVYMGMGNENIDNFGNYSYSAYVRTQSRVNEDEFNAMLKTIFDKQQKERFQGWDGADEHLAKIACAAIPLDRTYFDGYDVWVDRGNKTVFVILQLAVVLLLLIAFINFANFSMAQAPVRMRSINTRKVMGESNLSLRMRLIGEGVIICLIAFALSMLAVLAISKWGEIGKYTVGSIAIEQNLGIVLIVLLISIILGIIATSYSSRYITSFQPALALKGSFGLTPSGRFVRQILVGVQMILAFVMIIFVSIIYCQSSYIYNSSYGYEKDALIFGELPYSLAPHKPALRSELEKINGVESVSFSANALGIGDNSMGWGRGEEDEYRYFSVIPADWKLLRTLGIEIVEGRDFTEHDGDVYIINEAMKNKYPMLQIDKPLCKNDLDVIGICKNFRAFTTRIDNNQTPVAFVIFGEQYKEWGDQCRFLYVRIAPNTNKVDIKKKIDAVLSSFASEGISPDLYFQDDCMEIAYKDEMRFMTQMKVSTMLAFLITIIGVFCLTMFETEYRRKEIAIRKVMGSSVAEVLILFAMRYTMPILLSFAIAAPVGYYIGDQWLQNFAEHTPIYLWIFPLAFVIVSAIVLATVVVQSWRVATMNPNQSIKTE